MLKGQQFQPILLILTQSSVDGPFSCYVVLFCAYFPRFISLHVTHKHTLTYTNQNVSIFYTYLS